MDIRKVQQVGYSTLIVSLPRDWANEVGLKQGDVVSFLREDDGSLKLRPGIAKEEREAVKCVVDADQCIEPGILSRVITGAYIIGHDTIQVSARRELKQEHLSEVRNVSQRLNGIGIVEQSLRQVTVQSFVDPTRFPVDGLLRRIYIISSSMQDASIIALKERRKDLAEEVIHMEDEVDRIYWLVVRQLLLAVRDRNVGKKIGIDSPLHIVGNRLVAKSLEKIGDFALSMAKEVINLIELGTPVKEELLDDITSYSKKVREVFDKTMKSLFSLDLKIANDAIESVDKVEQYERKLTEKILFTYQKPSKGESDSRIWLRTVMSLRSIVWNLGLIARYCSTIAEIAINRTLEQPSTICRFEGVQ